MGTFTVTYFAKKAFWDKRNYWLISAAAYYFGRCWDNAGYAKAEMMKGHSRMFADRHQQITQNSHADPWKY